MIGLGRFGTATALQLARQGREVLGVERDAQLVQKLSGQLTHVVEAEATDIDALRQLGAAEFDSAVVGVGTSIESSVLITANLVDLGVSRIWAKAITTPHAEILEQLGVHHVISPEHDMGVRSAHLIQGRALDFVTIDEGFALIRCPAPEAVQQRPLDTLSIRRTHGVSIVAVRRLGQGWEATEPGTVLYENDQILVTGPTRAVEAFSDLD